jgi:hypothetical protein
VPAKSVALIKSRVRTIEFPYRFVSSGADGAILGQSWFSVRMVADA